MAKLTEVEPGVLGVEQRRAGHCKSCGAAIVWLATAKGNAMPVEAHTVQREDTQFDAKRHTSHFAECPDASKHRRSR